MELKVGKRYVLRDGRITGPLENHNSHVYKYRCTKLGLSWKPNGSWEHDFAENSKDIVTEYKEYLEPTANQVLLIASSDIKAGDVIKVGVNAKEYVAK